MKKLMIFFATLFFVSDCATAQKKQTKKPTTNEVVKNYYPGLKPSIKWNVDMKDLEAIPNEIARIIKDCDSKNISPWSSGDQIFFGTQVQKILQINLNSEYKTAALLKKAYKEGKVYARLINASNFQNSVYSVDEKAFVKTGVGKTGQILVLSLDEEDFTYDLCKLESNSIDHPERPCFNPNLLGKNNAANGDVIDAGFSSRRKSMVPTCDSNIKELQNTSRIDAEYVILTYKNQCGGFSTQKMYDPIKIDLGLDKAPKHRRYLGWKIGVPVGLALISGGIYLCKKWGKENKHTPPAPDPGGPQDVEEPIGDVWEELRKADSNTLPNLHTSNQFTIGLVVKF